MECRSLFMGKNEKNKTKKKKKKKKKKKTSVCRLLSLSKKMVKVHVVDCSTHIHHTHNKCCGRPYACYSGNIDLFFFFFFFFVFLVVGVKTITVLWSRVPAKKF